MTKYRPLAALCSFAALASLTLAQPGLAAETSKPTENSARTAPGRFASPPTPSRPLYRFWNTGGLMTERSIREQVQQIKASGAGGFEANQLISTVTPNAPGYQAESMSWGTPAWTEAWTRLLEAGKAAGLRVDQIYTPGWSAGTQTVSPDGPGSAKEIAFGSAFLGAGERYQGPVPASKLPQGVTKRELQGVIAYRCLSACDGEGDERPVLDPKGTVLRPAGDGSVTFQAPAAPAGARYVLVGAWMQGTGQTVALASTPRPTYLVDHFDREGWRAVEDYWDKEVFTPRLRAAMRASGGSMFFDSLELNREGVEVRSWTPRLLTEFQRRKGYSLVPYLAGVAVVDPVFEFRGDTGVRVREDVNDVMSALFVDHHLVPLNRWARGLGLTVRAQAYSSWGPTGIDFQDTARHLDVPEGEDLSFSEGFSAPDITTSGADAWRSLASAGAQAGKNVISTECCALLGNYSIPRSKLLKHVNQQFSVGVNQMVWHGWADQTDGSGYAWPGNQPFGPLVSDTYGVQNPTFRDDADINTYVGRTQEVLRRGTVRDDIAIYRDSIGHRLEATGTPYFADQSLARAGHTYGFVNETALTAPDSRAAGRSLRVGQQTYKALVLDGTRGVDTNPTMTLAAAQRVLSWARDGLPVVVVGQLPGRTRGLAPQQDAELRRVQRQLLATPGVRTVRTQADVLRALDAAGVRSAVRYAAPAPLVARHRADRDTDYYYLFNAGPSATTTDVSLQGTGLPYRYDAWTGAVTPVRHHQRTSDGVRLRVQLRSGDGTLLAVTRGNPETGSSSCVTAVRRTTADTVVSGAKGRVQVRVSKGGTYRTTLDGGRVVTSAIGPVGAATRPSSWSLEVESWQAGTGGPSDTDKVALPTVPLVVQPDGSLPDWLRIPGLQNKSGIGTYRATFDLPEGQNQSAYLDLGTVRGLATVSLNGRALPVLNQLETRRVDLASAVRPGRNELVVRVSTLLGNAVNLSALNGPQSYGLVGPVVVRPYRFADVVRDRSCTRG